MLIGEYWADEQKPVIDGDWIRNVLVLGRESKNPADTDGKNRGKSKVTRKFNTICESEALYGKFDGCEAHVGPHKFDGNYPADALMGSWHNPRSVELGLRMDILCKKVGESYHPQAIALRDHIEHNRPFGGFSPLFSGDTDQVTGEVTTVDNVAGIDWVPSPGSVKSIVESEAMAYEHGKEMAEMRAEHERFKEEHHRAIAECHSRIGECHEMIRKHVAECSMPKRVGESASRTEPIPEIKIEKQDKVDPFKFIRNPTK